MSRLFFSMVSSLVHLLAVPAEATVQRAHVSAAHGADSNTAFNCDAAHPCRTFQTATTVVSSGGEVVALDSGGYGTVNITQSISLIAPAGVYAGISVFAGANGITIDTPDVNVMLHGLTINGMGGDYGVLMTNGSSLTVDHCSLSGFSSAANNATAISVSVASVVKVQIKDTAVSNNYAGVTLDGAVKASLTRVSTFNNNLGVALIGSTNETTAATVNDGVATGNQFAYIVLGTNTSIGNFEYCTTCTRALTITSSVVSGGYSAVLAVGNQATVAVSGSTLSDNTVAFYGSTATLTSAGNNTLFNNTTAVNDTITTGGLIY